MKVEAVIVTCVRDGMASQCLPMLVRQQGVNVKAVICAEASSRKNLRYLWRRLKKIIAIGLLGAWNGRRMRPWYHVDAPDIEELCRKLHVPFHIVPLLNGREMEDLLTSLRPTLGVSLGNGYISPRIFSIPKMGMINVHSEILPAYQNAQSVIWPIFKEDPHSGFTIHEIERKIDSGRILLQRKYDLEFYPTLEATVRYNKVRIDADIPESVAYVCEHIAELRNCAQAQRGGGHYTTPTFWQYLRMVKNNRRFYINQQRQKEHKV